MTLKFFDKASSGGRFTKHGCQALRNHGVTYHLPRPNIIYHETPFLGQHKTGKERELKSRQS